MCKYKLPTSRLSKDRLTDTETDMTQITYHAVFAGGQRAFVITNEQNFLRAYKVLLNRIPG